MKVPTIYDLVESESESIKQKEERLSQLEGDKLNSYICHTLKKEIKSSTELIKIFKTELRENKLKELGI
jgi:hypothetical protein